MRINIPSPCSENWNNMIPEEGKRFCSSCQKSVHDFSSYSDEQLIEFFQKKNQSTCGRFGDDQLSRALIFSKPVNTFGNKWVAAFIGVFALLKTTEAQTIQKKDENGFVITEKKEEPKIILKVTRGTDIKGFVKNEQTGETIKGVGVIVTGSGNSSFTDQDGKFTISTADIKNNSNLSLKFYHSSFKEKEVNVVFVKEKIMDTVQLEIRVVELEEFKVMASKQYPERGITMGVIAMNRTETILAVKPQSGIKSFFHRIFHWRKNKNEQAKENEE